MTKITPSFAAILTTLTVLAIFALATGVSADTRDSRDRGATGRAIEPTPTPSPAPSPAPVPAPPPSAGGGITSSTNGSVSTGDNLGGTVTTGDESVEVHEVNIGPTNPPPPADPELVEGPPPPVPEPQCDRRSSPSGCLVESVGRTR